jgi:hypothetical protein
MRKSLLFLAGAAVLGAGTIAVAAYNQVPTKATAADAEALQSLVGAVRPLSANASFEEQLRVIKLVQNKVLHAAPVDTGIALGRSRELADVIAARHGLCYDRSRAIEDGLRVLGLTVRHISVYSTAKHAPVVSLVTPGTESHALTEVRTKRGWMLVDSNSNWLSLRADNRPLSIAQLHALPVAARSEGDGTPAPPVFQHGGFTWLYGLYSRHGEFYPPYNRVPDVNWSEFAANL